jgi:hypothetical protein
MNSKRTSNESSRIDLLRSIANSVVDDEVYVPTDDELRTLGLDTRPGRKAAKCIVSGNHAADPVSWHVYEIEVPDSVRKSNIKLRYRAWSALDGPGRAITGIGRLELDGVGVNQSLLRKKLKEIWTPHNEDAISEDNLSNEARSQLDEVVSEVDEEQKRSAEEVAGHYGGPAGMPGICDDHRIWLTVEETWAKWSYTVTPIEELIPRDDAHLREDIKQAIKAAAREAMDTTSHVETGAHHEYKVEYRLEPSSIL